MDWVRFVLLLLIGSGIAGFVLYSRREAANAPTETSASRLPGAAPPHQPVRIAARLIREVEAERPWLKRRLGEKGPVRFSATVTTAGKLTDFVLLSGPKGLEGAAEKAAEKWRCEPATVDGQPVEQIVTIKVNFRN